MKRGVGRRIDRLMLIKSRRSRACKQRVSRLAQNTTVRPFSLPFLSFSLLNDLTVAVGNEQEKERDTINSVIDDRVNHEVRLFLPPRLQYKLDSII